jgi:large subunit ribosomal protein L35
VPKIKTHKATAKRFRRTGTGKLLCRHQGRGHLRRNKSPRTLIKYRVTKVIKASVAEKQVSRLAPYID